MYVQYGQEHINLYFLRIDAEETFIDKHKSNKALSYQKCLEIYQSEVLVSTYSDYSYCKFLIEAHTFILYIPQSYYSQF